MLPAQTIFAELDADLRQLTSVEVRGTVISVTGLELRGEGLAAAARIGAHVIVADRVRGEIVGFDGRVCRILPFGSWEGVAVGNDILMLSDDAAIRPSARWLGRVIDPFGAPLDNAPLAEGRDEYALRNTPPDAFSRRRVGAKMETGVKVLDMFVPICRGQRLGIFAGSGVGKSTLLGMLARQAEADVIVIGLVGERGKEVQAFIKTELGDAGMSRTVLVVATSDQPSLTRRQAAWTATAVAEHFRDQGKDVLLMLDSVTRFAMAQREIGLAAGEPPIMKGYTPTVLTEMPKLLERSGPGNPDLGQGDITAIYTVLVDGDDMNEIIADTARGILDGHIVLDRKIAEKGRYPAVDVLKSVSRELPRCHAPAERVIMGHAKRAMGRYADMEELVRIGAYKPGADPETDTAIAFASSAEPLLRQGIHEPTSSAEGFAALYGLLSDAGCRISHEELEAG